MGTRDCGHICNVSTPGIGEAGNTGEWRNQVPVIDLKKCLASKLKKAACFICWLYCPEAVISKTVPPKIDLNYCKGCGICASVCPPKAILMEKEGVGGSQPGK